MKFIISSYIQHDGRPIGTKHVAYHCTKNVLSLLTHQLINDTLSVHSTFNIS